MVPLGSKSIFMVRSFNAHVKGIKFYNIHFPDRICTINTYNKNALSKILKQRRKFCQGEVH